MRKNSIIYLLTLVFLVSCASEEQTNDLFILEDTDQELVLTSSEDIQKILNLSSDSIDLSYDNLEKGVQDLKWGKKPEPFINKVLPVSYTNRTFLKNLGPLTYKIDELPGHILKYDSNTKIYRIVSLTRFIKDGKYPDVELIEDGIIYSHKINSQANFNASALIGGLSAEKETILELIIQDVVNTIVPDSLILEDKIKAISSGLDKSERKNYFYIKGATLTLINNKKFNKQKFSAKVNSSYVTAEGETFSSDDQFSRERIVTVDLISLEDLINLSKDKLADLK